MRFPTTTTVNSAHHVSLEDINEPRGQSGRLRSDPAKRKLKCLFVS